MYCSVTIVNVSKIFAAIVSVIAVEYRANDFKKKSNRRCQSKRMAEKTMGKETEIRMPK